MRANDGDDRSAMQLEGALAARLGAVTDRVRWGARLERFARRAAGLPVAFVGVVAADALVALPDWLLAAGDGALGLWALWAVAGLALPGRLRRAGDLHAARRLEDAGGAPGGTIVAAAQLAARAQVGVELVGAGGSGARTHGSKSSDLQRVLAERALRRGLDAAERVPARCAAPMRGAGRACGRLALAAAVLLASAALAPRVFRFGAARLLDPFGGRAPYTLTDFRVTVLPEEPLVADHVTIRVDLGGVVPERVHLEFGDARGREVDRAAMRALNGGEDERPTAYAITLREVREPLRLVVRAETGRSDRIAIDPIPRPRVREAAALVTPPAYTGWPARFEAIERGEESVVRALVGSTVRVSATATTPLVNARVDGHPAWTAGVDAGAAFAEGIVAGPEEMRLRLVASAESGLSFEAPVSARVDGVADAPPDLALELPGPADSVVYVLEGRAAPIRAVARDDVRVDGVRARWIARRGTQEIGSGEASLLDAVDGAASVVAAGEFDTNAIGARARDRITLIIAAVDNRPSEFGGAQWSSERLVTIEVVDGLEASRLRALAQEREAGEAPEGGGGGASDGDETEAGEGPARPTPGEGGGEQPAEGDGAPGAAPPGLEPSEGEGAEPQERGASAGQAGEGGEERGGSGGTGGAAAPRVFDDPATTSSGQGPLRAAEPASESASSLGEEGEGTSQGASAGAPARFVPRAEERSSAGEGERISVPAGSLADVPPAYRDAAARYFRRLAEQEAAPR